MEHKTVSDYLLEKPRQRIPEIQCDFPGCSGSHEPNAETEQVFKDTDAGCNLESHDSLKDFWQAMHNGSNAPKFKYPDEGGVFELGGI